MYLQYKDKVITGILSIVPANEVAFEDEMDNYAFTREQCLQLKKVMGYNKHRVCKTEACISDLIIHGFRHLFAGGALKPEEIDAFILLTNAPDYVVPPTSNVIQGTLGFKQDMVCMDINQGCAGFMVGLMQAFMMLEQPAIRKVALVTADIGSRTHSHQDRASFPLIGDAAAITIVENGSSGDIHQFMKMDGTGALSIWMPAGGLKERPSEATLRMESDGSGNFMNRHHVRMRGDDVFNFVMKEVPGMLKELFAHCGKTFDDVEYFMCHQPNKFILRRIAKKIGVPPEKMPSNLVEDCGNCISSTIPGVIAYNLADRLTKETIPLCLAGFGEGLIWSAALMELGPLRFCKMIEMDI